MRGKAHDENLFPLISLSDHPVPRGGLTRQRAPAFSSWFLTPAPLSDESFGRYTSASPLSHERGRGKSEGQITTSFWTCEHLSARGHGRDLPLPPDPVNPQQDSNS